MLYIFGGLPGTGKTTLARHLARVTNAMHLRIDTIEQALRENEGMVNGTEGYVVAYRVAADNLALGLSVVADSVNPLGITRAAWRKVATDARVPFVEIEIICSDPNAHRARVEERKTDIEGLTLPTWEKVMQRHYEVWTTPHLVIDTAGQTVSASAEMLDRALGAWLDARLRAQKTN